jgi:peroxiredoxin
MRIRRFITVFAFLSLLGALRSVGVFAAPGIGDKAPGFSLKDLKGATVRLSDLKGKVVLISFSTTWCPHCRTAIPGLNQLAARYKEKEFALLGVYIQESAKKVSSFVEKHGVTYRVLLDDDGGVAKAYGVRGIPSKTLVGRDGTVICRDCRDVEKELEKLLGGTGQ